MSRNPSRIVVPSTSLTAQVVAWFAREIRGGHLKPGEKLPTEQELIAQFGVSRTVVREAMASLRSDGLVASRQGSGVFVSDPQASPVFRIVSQEVATIEDVRNVLQLRLAVEVEAAGMAAKNRTETDLESLNRHLEAIDASIAEGGMAVASDFAFHRAISTATGNPYFERFLHFLGPVIIPRQSIRPVAETSEQRRHYLQQVQLEHRRIVHAIERSNVEAARFSLREHLEAARERYGWTMPDGPPG